MVHCFWVSWFSANLWSFSHPRKNQVFHFVEIKFQYIWDSVKSSFTIWIELVSNFCSTFSWYRKRRPPDIENGPQPFIILYAVNDKYKFPSNTFVCVTAPRPLKKIWAIKPRNQSFLEIALISEHIPPFYLPKMKNSVFSCSKRTWQFFFLLSITSLLIMRGGSLTKRITELTYFL